MTHRILTNQDLQDIEEYLRTTTFVTATEPLADWLSRAVVTIRNERAERRAMLNDDLTALDQAVYAVRR